MHAKASLFPILDSQQRCLNCNDLGYIISASIQGSLLCSPTTLSHL